MEVNGSDQEVPLYNVSVKSTDVPGFRYHAFTIMKTISSVLVYVRSTE